MVDAASSSDMREARPRRQRIALRRLRAAFARPTVQLWTLLVLHMVLWGVLPALVTRIAPTDNLEQLIWAQTAQLAYLKHPPLPSWLLFAAQSVVGPSLALTFLLGAASTAVGLVIVLRFGTRLVNSSRAAMAMWLTAPIAYFSVKSSIYNHNTLQIPLSLAMIASFHAALERGRWRDWVWFGVWSAAMMLTKYSAVVFFAAFGLYVLVSGRWADRRVWIGGALALVVVAALVAPHGFAAAALDAGEGRYAESMVFPPEIDRWGRLASVWSFVGSQLGAVLPAVIVMCIGAWRARRAAAPDIAVRAPRAFLRAVALGPFALTSVGAVVLQARLLSGWGTAFFSSFGLWLASAERFAPVATRRTVRRVAAVSIAVQLALGVAIGTHEGVMPDLKAHRARPAPPAPETLGARLEQHWRARTGQALRYVFASQRAGGALVTQFRGRVTVIDEDAGVPPSYRRDHLDTCGLLVVTERRVERIGERIVAPDDPAFDAVEQFEAWTLTDRFGPRTYWVGWRLPAHAGPC